MHPIVLQFLLSVSILTALDAVWFSVVMNRFFIDRLAHLLNIQNSHVVLLWGPAIAVYCIMGLTLVLFVYPSNTLLASVPVWVRGALLGALVYGVFEMTNAATLKDWPTSLIIVDILWGACGWGLTSYILSVLGHAS